MRDAQTVMERFAGMTLLLVLAIAVNETGQRYDRRSWQRFACKAIASVLMAALIAVALATP